MSIQTEWMRNTDEWMIDVYKDENGWHGIEYVNHPTPSGCERWMPTFSDKRNWPDKESALENFKKLLDSLDKI